MKELKSEMAGTLIEYLVKVGDTIEADQEVATLESMKMEVGVTSTEPGVVKELKLNSGDFVNEGDTLIVIEGS